MSEHRAWVRWERAEGDDFARGRYRRLHSWRFDGGAVIAASPSPSVVRAPYSDPAAVDPEEAFVASIASCHMLTFLYLAAKEGLVVEAYDDAAVGTMTKNAGGTPWVSRVELRPRVRYAAAPSPELEARLHHRAHEQCFISASVKTEIEVLPPVSEEGVPR